MHERTNERAHTHERTNERTNEHTHAKSKHSALKNPTMTKDENKTGTSLWKHMEVLTAATRDDWFDTLN
jgi:hypothetical protein